MTSQLNLMTSEKFLYETSQKYKEFTEKGGYIYLIQTEPNSKLVKIGKTKLKYEESEEQCLARLFSRYKTSCPRCKILKFELVNNCDDAENYIFRLLDKFRYSGEFFFMKENLINQAFGRICEKYLPITKSTKFLAPEILTEINMMLRDEKIEKN